MPAEKVSERTVSPIVALPVRDWASPIVQVRLFAPSVVKPLTSAE